MFRFRENPGPYSAGVTVVEQYDYSRAYRWSSGTSGRPSDGAGARPLQTLIWYPAVSGNQSPMTVADYASLWATETSFGKPRLPARAVEFLTSIGESQRDSLAAVRDASHAPGRFPAVIYAPSFSSVAWENADLCEFLASCGYVVVATPSLGPRSRSMTLDLDGLNAQAGDIGFLVGHVQTLAYVDPAHVAVAGFSWGGLSNLVAASRDPRIKALVCLDGSLRYFPGLVVEARIRPEELQLPLLYFSQHEYSLEEFARYTQDPKRQGPSVLNAWRRGDLALVHMLGLSHEEFGSMLQRSADMWSRLWDIYPMMKADYRRDDGAVGYAWMAKYTVRFLDAYLKHDGLALAFLTQSPERNGAPPHVMAVSVRKATKDKETLEEFRACIEREGFHAMEATVAQIEARGAKPLFAEQALLDWAEEMIDADHLPEALQILELNVHLHPGSADAYAYLARACEKCQEIQMSRDHYERALTLNSMHALARVRLARLARGDVGQNRAS